MGSSKFKSCCATCANYAGAGVTIGPPKLLNFTTLPGACFLCFQTLYLSTLLEHLFLICSMGILSFITLCTLTATALAVCEWAWIGVRLTRVSRKLINRDSDKRSTNAHPINLYLDCRRIRLFKQSYYTDRLERCRPFQNILHRASSDVDFYQAGWNPKPSIHLSGSNHDEDEARRHPYTCNARPGCC
jgi:hypothetical protein